MAKFGFHIGKYGAHVNCSVDEGRTIAIPGLVIALSLTFIGVSVKLIYHKAIKTIDKEFEADKQDNKCTNVDIPTTDIKTNDPHFATEDTISTYSYNGHSSTELFNRLADDSSNWIVDSCLKEGQIGSIVAGAGIGKSLIAIQIAIAVANGTRPEFLPDTCRPSVKRKVVIVRLEDFNDELKGKYGDGKVLRETGIEWVTPERLPSFTLKGLSELLNSLAAQMNEDTVVFIDPVTKLPDYNHKNFISDAEKAMGIAKDRHMTLTIIVVAHHDEKKDSQSLDSCDIKGGDGLLQQAGAVMALRKERTGNEYRFIQCLKAPKGSPEPFDSDVLVMKLVNKNIDEHNRYPHFKYVDIKKVTEALPIKPKAAPSSVEISTVQPTSPQFDNTTNNLPEWKGKLPLGLAMQMKEDYKPGQAGAGLKQMAKKYKLRNGTEVSRELEKLDKYLQEQKGETEQ